ncbi:MAG TPA: TetR/AcrR family transcriptional regulator [Acidimicrobiales bacterium]|nr:TetR/AcrR family transcriptional regulator [Acidimicrobiales bacterium]
MEGRTTKSRRGRGRPPKSEGLVTSQRLLEAAAAACAEYGFDGSTLARIAEKADVHPTAIYNHYRSREELLYAAAVQALDKITAVAFEPPEGPRSVRTIAAAYLQPGMAQQRRLIAEIHVASSRDPRLAELLVEWHRAWAEPLIELLAPTDPNPRATVKVLYLLLLGLCHLDDVADVRANRSSVVERAERLVDVLVPGVDSRREGTDPVTGGRPRARSARRP